MVAPSAVDLRTSVELDRLALESAPDYEALLLSPVAPLGSTSVLAPTSQDRVLSTMRPLEVVSDPTNPLALEAAARLRRDAGTTVRLATLHQTLRMQPVPAGAGFTRHFRLFALADAGRARGDDAFETEAVVAHLEAYRGLYAAASARFDLGLKGPRAIVRAEADGPLGDRVAAAIADAFPEVEVQREPLEGTYYGGLRVGYGMHDLAGEFRALVDLGRFDWVAQLLSDRRYRFVASAIGIQLLAPQ